MSIDHVNISDPYIHQPKGASTASANTVIIADGSGSTSWGKITTSQVDASSIKNLNTYALTVRLDNIGNAGSTFVAVPAAGTIVGMYVTPDSNMSTTATNISLEIGGVAVTNSTATLSSSAVAGDVASAAPTANNVVTAGAAVEIISDGGTTGSSTATVTLIVSM